MTGLWQRLRGSVRSEPWTEVVYWALDLETSGLDPRRDEILAVGMVPIRAGAVRWGERFTTLVRPDRPGVAAGAGLAAHHLLPGEVAAGVPLQEAVDEILRRIEGGALLVHCAPVDVPFLRAACASCGRRWPAVPVVDTAALVDQMARLDYPKVAADSSLSAARARFGLPEAAQHDALADALATAELFLALRHHLQAIRLGDLL